MSIWLMQIGSQLQLVRIFSIDLFYYLAFYYCFIVTFLVPETERNRPSRLLNGLTLKEIRLLQGSSSKKSISPQQTEKNYDKTIKKSCHGTKDNLDSAEQQSNFEIHQITFEGRLIRNNAENANKKI